MELPKVIVSGKFAPEDLVVSVSESNRKIDPAIEGQLESLWQAKKKQADKDGKNCYNGISYRLNTIEEQDGKVKMDFGTVEYKVWGGLVDIPEYFDLPEAYYRKCCFSTSTVKTLDDRYLMVELSGKSMNQNTTDFIGGIMETNSNFQSGQDIFKSFFDELVEEAGIREQDMRECFLKTIYLEARANVGFYFEVILNISSSELLERFKENQDGDIKALCVYTKEEYLEALETHRSPNKQFIARHLLHI